MTTPLRPPRSRGQALVLSALGMVLLVLMVTMTLSFGTKAKQKMEVQVVADQAAYSSAVAVARTYNVLSMTNRVMIAHMTALLGIQSAISFSGAWVVIVTQMLILYSLEIANQLTCCNKGCWYYGCFTAMYVLFTRWFPTFMEWLKLLGTYSGLDAAAAAQARRTGFANIFLYGGQLETVSNRLFRALDDQETARRVTNKASGGVADWQVNNGGDDVAKREAGFIFGSFVALGVGAINQTNLIITDRHAVVASVGSRGHPFTANRFTYSFFPNGVLQMMNAGFQRIGASSDIRFYVHQGSAYFGAIPHNSATLVTMSTFAISDDHGIGLARYSGPAARSPLPMPLIPVSLVMSNPSMGMHIGGIFVVIQIPIGPSFVPVFIPLFLFAPPFFPDAIHQVPALCLINCPSVWSNFVDYNMVLVIDERDNFAQPKLPVTVTKDARLSKPDPFNLFFNFRFSSAGAGQTFDMKHGSGANGGGISVRDGAGTTDISQQMGYSTGIAYYHRADHWREPPNLFNAYWRAGLTRPDTDRAARIIPNDTDIEDTMRDSGAPWAASAFTALINRGYQGIRP